VERGSDKHSPRLDEGLKHDTRSVVQGSPVEARAEEARSQEDAGDGERTWINDRAELARHLDPSVYPATKDALLADAEKNSAPEWIFDALGQLPDGQSFQTNEEVWEALGGVREQRS
jgi:hypothetical protein